MLECHVNYDTFHVIYVCVCADQWFTALCQSLVLLNFLTSSAY